MEDIKVLAKKLVADGKGVFAADASEKTIEKRLLEWGISGGDEEARRRYREVLFTAKQLGKYIGGVIMHEESLNQKARDGKSFVEHLNSEGIMVGVKVDRGTVDVPNFEKEKFTEGLDGLSERLKKYYELGARFTKWRAVIVVDERRPSRPIVVANASILARYALLSQQAGMVPIVEPEVLMEGTHTIERCAEVTEMVSRVLFETMLDLKVDMHGLLYKTNMVVMGTECKTQVSDEEVAKKTVEVLKKTVSVGTPGVVFLSGGQEALTATKRLNLINQMGAGVPWRWTFSFERAFEEPVMKVWLGKDENVETAQQTLLKRAEMNSLASQGKYLGE